jgi:hypothetical protein
LEAQMQTVIDNMIKHPDLIPKLEEPVD